MMLVMLAVIPFGGNAFGLDLLKNMKLFGVLSPKNRERPLRATTDYIILHTTEGKEQGSLQKVVDNGEANFFVTSDGRVLKIVDRKRIAYHCGTSMWNGRTDIDNYSIGIEVQGWYNADITAAQYAALKDLIADLQEIYKIPDDRVLTHCMVAYGKPNRWHSRPHRGRKRCGMLFTRTGARAKLGLTKRPAYDPDVKASRLVVGDAYLAQVVYGIAPVQDKALTYYASREANVISAKRTAWDISGDDYNSSKVLYIFPDGKRLRGSQVKDWSSIPSGTRVVRTQ